MAFDMDATESGSGHSANETTKTSAIEINVFNIVFSGKVLSCRAPEYTHRACHVMRLYYGNNPRVSVRKF